MCDINGIMSRKDGGEGLHRIDDESLSHIESQTYAQNMKVFLQSRIKRIFSKHLVTVTRTKNIYHDGLQFGIDKSSKF